MKKKKNEFSINPFFSHSFHLFRSLLSSINLLYIKRKKRVCFKNYNINETRKKKRNKKGKKKRKNNKNQSNLKNFQEKRRRNNRLGERRLLKSLYKG